MLYSMLLVHSFFIELFTETIIDILFLWKAVANIFWAPKYLVNFYPHKFTIPLLDASFGWYNKVGIWAKK